MIKESLKNGSFVLGTWCDLPSPSVVNVLAKAKLDFVIIDMEHGPMDYKTAQEMAMAAESEGCEALIRVPQLNGSDILRALDTGVAGIIIPHIESVEDRKKVVKFSKFPPQGHRGFNPYVRSGGYKKGNDEYFSAQNNRIILGLIVEGPGALKDLDNIIDDPEIDVVYIGTYDLSVALELPGDVQNPKVIEALEKAVAKIRKAGKSAGCMAHNTNDLNKFKKLGIQFICFKVDSSIIHDTVAQFRKEFDQ